MLKTLFFYFYKYRVRLHNRVRLTSRKYPTAHLVHSPVLKKKDVFKKMAYGIKFDFRKFFIDASTVDAAEQQFNIDEYSDITMVTKPVVYMTVQEIIDTHQVELISSHGILFLSVMSLPLYPKAIKNSFRNQSTHFSPVLYFTYKPAIRCALQIKTLVSILNATLS